MWSVWALASRVSDWIRRKPIEHSVLEKSSHDKPMEEAPVLDPLEYSVLGKPLDGGSLEGRSVVDWFV